MAEKSIGMKITIDIRDANLKKLKDAYKRFFGSASEKNPKKSDIVSWLGTMVEADLLNYMD